MGEVVDPEIEGIYFPYRKVRDIQKDLILKVKAALDSHGSIIVHAPTGLGKTIATIAPALSDSLKTKSTVFFLTSRHTQHIIAIETLREIKEKHGLNIVATDIIGKKWMCPVPGVEKLYSGDFAEYCKAVREDNRCEFYTKTKKGTKLSTEAELAIATLIEMSPCHSDKIMEVCQTHRLCPYEIATELAKRSNVIIADYYYVFNPHIRDTFFKRAEKQLENCVVIVDEGHNLPGRLRNLLSEKLTTIMLENALREADKHGYEQTADSIRSIANILKGFMPRLGQKGEALVSKEDFIKSVEIFANYDDLIADFRFVGEAIREKEKASYIASIANFLENWLGEDKGFVRIFSKRRGRRDKEALILSYRCLDPSFLSKDITARARSTIVMSGTMHPIEMYRDLLGCEKAELLTYKSPFPQDNKLNLVIPKTTTKYSERTDEQFKNIANICAEITDSVPGNIIIFFPSYDIRDRVNQTFERLCKKTVFIEVPNLTKEEKTEILDRFKSYKSSGAVLLAAVSGSFGEGIDLPGEYLNAAVIVGLPLTVPDLETDALIKYFDDKFGKGWDYGYVFPAMNKVMQNAGRVIRSETDRGAIIFLDERYSWHQYSRCFPKDWTIVNTILYKQRIEEFFKKK